MFHCLVGTMVFRTTLLLVLFTVGWPTRLDAYYRKPKGFDTNLVPDDLWAPTVRDEQLSFVELVLRE